MWFRNLRHQFRNYKLRKLGWHPKIGLETGICKTYAWFMNIQDSDEKKNIN